VEVITATTGQLQECGCCVYGSETHPFESVTVTDVPAPDGIPETVTELPETVAVPADEDAVKGPVPEVIANVIE